MWSIVFEHFETDNIIYYEEINTFTKYHNKEYFPIIYIFDECHGALQGGGGGGVVIVIVSF